MRDTSTALILALLAQLVSFEVVFADQMQLFDIDPDIASSDSCYYRPTCDPNYKYRTINGSCNNLDNPVWGVMNTPYLRYLPAYYQDGYFEVRKATDGSELPNVRELSVALFQSKTVQQDRNHSMITALWGQFITHDFSGTVFMDIDGCCDGKAYPEKQRRPYCMPIQVSESDPFYSKHNVTCMHYSRQYTTENLHYCYLKPAQTVSNVTHYIDLSVLYGNLEDPFFFSPRTYQGGQLETMSTPNGKQTLTFDHKWYTFCRISSANQSCLVGDKRLNQNPAAGAMSVLMTKEHNRLAEGLSEVNPHWDDETLYQEARRILTAQAQHITYSEYLPTIISPEYYTALSLQPLDSGYTEYNSSVRVGSVCAINGAVNRLSHSILQPDINLVPGGESGYPTSCKNPSICSCPYSKISFEDFWWQAGDIVNSCYDEIILGATSMNSKLMSNDVSSVFKTTYQHGDKEYGDDIVSIDITRGRDIGLPAYNEFRKLCALSHLNSFDDLDGVFRPESIGEVRRLYASVEDIDLYVGSAMELPVAPGFSGPTSQCLMAQQYARFKLGDRFYYEHGQMPTSFTSQQLSAIRKTTLGSIMCAHIYEGNNNHLNLQKNVFLVGSSGNDLANCDDFYSLDLQPWKELL